jgi:hypothetical protein
MLLLREYIKELLLNEAQKNISDLPEGYHIRIQDRGKLVFFDLIPPKDEKNPIKAHLVLDKIEDIYEVVMADAMAGWGPFMYDLAMEYGTINGRGIMSDRMATSKYAKKVWNFYHKSREDVSHSRISPEDEERWGREHQDESLKSIYTKEPILLSQLSNAGLLQMI